MRPLLRAALALVAAATLAPAAHAQKSPPQVSPVNVQAALAGDHVTLVLVKDFMKIQNHGGLHASVEFPRYLPSINDEQIVLGRWLHAHTSGGTALPIDTTGATRDDAGNFIQTLRIAPYPPRQVVTVTLTTLVARRERPAPDGDYTIPPPDQYPEAVRPYLASTPMVDAKHPIVRDTAAAILAKTQNPVAIAEEIARLARERSYLPTGQMTEFLPISALTLKCGGSCCASAVAAAAVFRACGIPAQVTYCPPYSYVHGVVQFYIQDYGWVRMDGTSGSARYPLVNDANSLSLIRLFDTPIDMEQQPIAFAWPYQNNDADGPYTFTANGQPTSKVTMDLDPDVAANTIAEPFPHLEPGSWSAVLGTEPFEGPWTDWAALVERSAAAGTSTAVGPFESLAERLPMVRPYLNVAATWGMPAPESLPAPPAK